MVAVRRAWPRHATPKKIGEEKGFVGRQAMDPSTFLIPHSICGNVQVSEIADTHVPTYDSGLPVCFAMALEQAFMMANF